MCVVGGWGCCKGLSRKCGPDLHANGGPHLGSRKRHPRPGRPGPASARVSALSAIQFRDSPTSAAAPASGGWALLSATLCRRSPALGMGAATAVGPGAGVRARVGESGASAPCTLSTQGRGTVPTVDTPMPVAHSGTLCHGRPLPLWDKGRGRIPTRDLPRTAHAPTSGRGFTRPRECRRNGRLGQGNACRMEAPPSPLKSGS